MEEGAVRGTRILAPMVRAGTLPLRELCLRYGAHSVWGEELVDRGVVGLERRESGDGQRVEFVRPNESAVSADCGKVVFAVNKSSAQRTVFQLGTATPEIAVEAALKVARDVHQINVNMGCPKDFSLQGGMGAALLQKPEQAAAIIRALRNALPRETSVSCKIRLLATTEQTIDFARAMEAAGADAIAVHGRTRDERDHNPARWDPIRLVKQAVNVPVILNGDVFTFADFDRAIRETGVDGVMTARGALENPSIFSPDGLKDRLQMVKEYIEEARRCDNHYANTKYVVYRMLTGASRKDKTYKAEADAVQKCRNYEELAVALKMHNSSNHGAESDAKKTKIE